MQTKHTQCEYEILLELLFPQALIQLQGFRVLVYSIPQLKGEITVLICVSILENQLLKVNLVFDSLALILHDEEPFRINFLDGQAHVLNLSSDSCQRVHEIGNLNIGKGDDRRLTIEESLQLLFLCEFLLDVIGEVTRRKLAKYLNLGLLGEYIERVPVDGTEQDIAYVLVLYHLQVLYCLVQY